MGLKTPASVWLGTTLGWVKRSDAISLGKENYHVWLPEKKILNMNRSNSIFQWGLNDACCVKDTISKTGNSWLEVCHNVNSLKVNDILLLYIDKNLV